MKRPREIWVDGKHYDSAREAADETEGMTLACLYSTIQKNKPKRSFLYLGHRIELDEPKGKPVEKIAKTETKPTPKAVEQKQAPVVGACSNCPLRSEIAEIRQALNSLKNSNVNHVGTMKLILASVRALMEPA